MIAAVPRYLGVDFTTSPPGHRHGLYFSYWRQQDWSAEDKQKGKALKQILKLPDTSIQQIKSLNERQSKLVEKISNSNRQSLTIMARSVSPLATGMGIEHPLENGFAFLNPYGLPYLPGSSIKGVLRRAAQELIEEELGGWDRDWETALFGLETASKSDEAQRGALTFWDCIPELSGNSLGMDVMTPHYSDYYQGKASPHDAGQPNPIVFMVIPPQSAFTFHVICEQKYLPETLRGELWKSLLETAFSHAFDWLGFGAKTAVGYGAMEMDQEAIEEQKSKAEAERKEEEKRAQLAQATSNLPDDAAQIKEKELSGELEDNTAFLDYAESFMEQNAEPSEAAIHLLSEIMEKKWKGITQNPDATQGKKKKPKFKPRPKKITMYILKFNE